MDDKESRTVLGSEAAVDAQASPEVEALARELFELGFIAMKGNKFFTPSIWINMDPRQKFGWTVIAKYVLSNYREL